MSFENFIPEITAAEMTTEYHSAQVVIPTLNQDYEGTLAKGGVVHIVGAITPTIVDYKANDRKLSSEAMNTTVVDLVIDQEKAFAIDVDDIDAKQAAGGMDAHTNAAADALAEDAEKFAIAMLLSGGTVISTAKIDTPAKAKKAIGTIRTALTKAKVPTSDRFVAVNPAFADLLIEALGDAAAAGSDSELRNGQLTRLSGLTVLESAAFAEEENPVAVGYHTKSAAFVSQLAKTEAFRNPNSFADTVRGLNVYGGKVTRPSGVVVITSGAAAPAAA